MIIVFLVNSLVVTLVVVVHYKFLSLASATLPALPFPPHLRIVFGVFAALFAHAIEVWVFAFAYYFMHHGGTWGELTGNFDGSIFDCAYFSFTTYSTLGFGDIEPIGNIRYLTGIEALTGLVLVTWTASFLFGEMQKHWK